MGAFYRSIDTCVLGRKTYDLSVSFGMPKDKHGKKNCVFSRALAKAASPKVSIVSEDVDVFSERLSARHRDLGLKLLATKSFPDGWSDCHIQSEVNDPTAVAPIKSCRDGAVFFLGTLAQMQ